MNKDDIIRKYSGFSILEVLIVIGVVALISAVAAPGYLSWRANTRLRSATERFRGDLQLAKSRAIRDARTAIVEFSADSYFIFVDEGNGNGGPANGKYDRQEPVVSNQQMPAGVRLKLAKLTGEGNFDKVGSPMGLHQGSSGGQRPVGMAGALRNPNRQGRAATKGNAGAGGKQEPTAPVRSEERRQKEGVTGQTTQNSMTGTLLRKIRPSTRNRSRKDEGSSTQETPPVTPPSEKEGTDSPPAESQSIFGSRTFGFNAMGLCLNPLNIVLENSRGKMNLVAVSPLGHISVKNIN